MLTEAAQALRAVLEDFPPASPSERGTARRIEGAILALEAVQQTIESETVDGSAASVQVRRVAKPASEIKVPDSLNKPFVKQCRGGKDRLRPGLHPRTEPRPSI
jgi:hypothetical protein